MSFPFDIHIGGTTIPIHFVMDVIAFYVAFAYYSRLRSIQGDSIDRCCTHVIRPDGQLDSFCRYYFGPVSEKTCC